MNPLIAALLVAGVISDEEARTLNGLLNEGATRIEAEQRIAASFASGFENQRSRLIRALDAGNVDYRDPMLPTFWAAEHDLLARDVLPTLTGIAQDVALTATVRSGGLADWRTVNEAVIAWTDTHYRSVAGDALGSIPNLDATAREAVADAVNRWQRGELNAGPGPGGLPRLIAELQSVEEFGADRAARIAVTETTRIFAESERTAAQANPNMTYLVWQTSSDEATCLICAPMEGRRIPKGQTTFPGGYYPPAHPNCRCGVTAVTEFAAEVLSGAAVPGQVAAAHPLDAMKTVEEIEKWASKSYPNISFDFAEAHVDAIRPTMVQFDKLAKQYPEVASRLDYIGTYKGKNVGDDPWAWAPNAMAAATNDGRQIGINPMWYGDMDKLNEKLREKFVSNWSDADGSIEAVFTHEYGHQVENWLLSSNKSFAPFLDKDGFGSLKHTINLFNDANAPTSALSRYATTTNAIETTYSAQNARDKVEGWAEAFSAIHHKPASEWPEYVTRIDRLISTLSDTSKWQDATLFRLQEDDEKASTKAGFAELRKALGL